MRWFKHQSDARNSLKLRKVRRKYGANGYAIYWFCLEAIAYEVDKDNLTFDLKEDAETIAFELSIQESLVQEIMKYMVGVGLFESSTGVITCLKLAESIDKSMTNSPRMRAWLDTKNVMTPPDSLMTSTDAANTCAELEKKRKEKNKDMRICASDDESSKKKEVTQESFDYWWSIYPKKQDKKRSFKKWQSITKKLSDDELKDLTNKIALDIEKRVEDLASGSDKYLGFNNMHASTYLNNERWNDED